MAKKRAKSEEPKKTVKSEEPKKKKPISLNILEIAKRLRKMEESGLPSEYPATQVMMSDGVTSVEDALDGLTEDSGWVTIDSNYLWYRKIGAIVNVIVKTPSQSTSGWTLAGTLPTGARPYKAIYLCPYVESAYYNLRIDTDGKVYYYQTSSGSTTGSFVFIA